jgi:hypothetical protein
MLSKHPQCVITRGTTYENKANLAPAFLQKLLKYENVTYSSPVSHHLMG